MAVGNSQKSLQPFFSYEYCVLEGEACVNSSTIPDGKPNHVSVPFSKLFVGPCGDRSKVTGERLECATALFSKLYARAMCPLVLAPFGATTDKVQS